MSKNSNGFIKDNNASSLNVIQINSQCIRNKLLELDHLTHIHDIDVICIAEHWLTIDQADVFVPSSYVVADIMCRSVFKNGGVAIYLKRSINYIKINLDKFVSEINCELCCVKLLNENIIIVSVYRSPSGDLNVFLNLFENALRYLMKGSGKIIVCGDFNIDIKKERDKSSILFMNLLRSLDLICTYKNPTRNESCIDNIIVNFSQNLYSISILHGSFADHDPLLLKYRGGKVTCVDDKSYNIRKQTEKHISTFCTYLEAESWDFLGKISVDRRSSDANDRMLCDLFFKTFVHLWHLSSPEVNKKVISKNKSKYKVNWYNDNLKRSRNTMLAYHVMYKSLNDKGSVKAVSSYNMYLRMKKKYKADLNSAKRRACENYIINSKNKCKAAWDVIRNESSPAHTSLMTDFDPDELNDYFLKSVEELVGHVAPVNVNSEELLGLMKVNTENTFTWKLISACEILKVVSSLSNSKSTDYCWLSNHIIKRTIHLIQHPLALVFNTCINIGYFPDSLKISKVIPVHKKGCKSDFQNYRPISIVPIMSKVFESLLLAQVSNYFESNNFLSDCQYGFRAGKSTTMAVSKIVDTLHMAFEKKESSSMLLFDLTKAFDCILPDMLLKKLEYYGIRNRTLDIFKSYLSDRLQYVSINGNNSAVRYVKTGVPQGSVLGPFLFIVAINDLPHCIGIESILFADDTSILASAPDQATLLYNLQSSEQSVLNWFSANKLVCNSTKTQEIHFSFTQNLDEQCVKLLGFYIDNRLNWKTHVNYVCRKLSRVIFIFWRLKSYVSVELLRLMYFGLFQSHIQYGLLIWGHSTHVQSILLLQKKALRTIFGASQLDHCKPLFVRLQVFTVVNLYIYTVLLHTKSHLQEFSIREDFHSHYTRGKSKLHIPQHRLSITSKSLQINCIRLFNKLPESAHTTSFNNFKTKIHLFLINNPFYCLTEFMDFDLNIIF